MKLTRRHLMAGIGAGGVISGFAIGSAAFTRLETEREVHLTVSGDDAASVQFEVDDSYEVVSIEDDVFRFDIDKLAADGEGVNVDALFRIGTESDGNNGFELSENPPLTVSNNFDEGFTIAELKLVLDAGASDISGLDGDGFTVVVESDGTEMLSVGDQRADQTTVTDIDPNEEIDIGFVLETETVSDPDDVQATLTFEVTVENDSEE